MIRSLTAVAGILMSVVAVTLVSASMTSAATQASGLAQQTIVHFKREGLDGSSPPKKRIVLE